MRLDLNRAKGLAGLATDFRLRTNQDYENAQAAIKEKIVLARRSQNDDLAAQLSWAKEVFKKHWGSGPICPGCGGIKKKHYRTCSMCRPDCGGKRKHCFDSTKLNMDTTKDHEILHDQPIPCRRMAPSELRMALEALAKGKAGDSFRTPHSPNSIKSSAKTLNLQIAIRNVTPGEKDKKKVRYQVWRTDGQSEEQINRRLVKIQEAA